MLLSQTEQLTGQAEQRGLVAFEVLRKKPDRQAVQVTLVGAVTSQVLQ